MLTEPLTEYLRCQLDFTDMNVEAGEDIRWVTQSLAASVGMPDYDFYLFDRACVAILEFDRSGLLAAIRTTEDDDAVSQHARWRDVIWPHAVPHRRYLSTSDHRKGT